MCTIKFLEIFFRKFEYLLGNYITMLRKAKETKLKLIQESNKRLMEKGNLQEWSKVKNQLKKYNILPNGNEKIKLPEDAEKVIGDIYVLIMNKFSDITNEVTQIERKNQKYNLTGVEGSQPTVLVLRDKLIKHYIERVTRVYKNK